MSFLDAPTHIWDNIRPFPRQPELLVGDLISVRKRCGSWQIFKQDEVVWAFVTRVYPVEQKIPDDYQYLDYGVGILELFYDVEALTFDGKRLFLDSRIPCKLCFRDHIKNVKYDEV